ncbi:hypothetical protein Goari_006693 [Gossypium aridum]|uniref:Uncharacterized protein n=1 Tax=Gossypium aridum TaxID=34290 RepID=A0A7J8XNP6_GOSAI|nr:hypothetical protein [Gossypium aridum]
MDSDSLVSIDILESVQFSMLNFGAFLKGSMKRRNYGYCITFPRNKMKLLDCMAKETLSSRVDLQFFEFLLEFLRFEPV